MIDSVVSDLEKTAAIAVDHANLIIVAARAGENDPAAMNAGGIGERSKSWRREGRVSWRESGFDG